MSYTPTNWTDGTSPVDASNLNKLEQAVSENSDLIEKNDILGAGTALSEGQNLNDFTTPGRYNSAGSSVSSTLTNAPTTGAGFGLFVIRVGSAIMQLALLGGTSTSSSQTWMYIRTYVNSSWTSWYNFAGTRAS